MHAWTPASAAALGRARTRAASAAGTRSGAAHRAGVAARGRLLGCDRQLVRCDLTRDPPLSRETARGGIAPLVMLTRVVGAVRGQPGEFGLHELVQLLDHL